LSQVFGSADDTYTGALMERFYIHIAEGQPKATALRHAKLDLLARAAAMFHRIIGALLFWLEREKPRFLWGNDESRGSNEREDLFPRL